MKYHALIDLNLKTALVGMLAVAFTFALTTTAESQTKERRYFLGKDSQRVAGTPQGTVTEYQWLDSKIYPGTKRRYYVYVPAQYDASQSAALMVFQDGHAYMNENGEYRAPIIFDNLIHRQELPVMIGVFIDPGHLKDELPEKRGWNPKPENRSVEYDSLSDTYSKFVLEEILPDVEKNYTITKDPL